jgi:hypothetical protein
MQAFIKIHVCLTIFILIGSCLNSKKLPVSSNDLCERLLESKDDCALLKILSDSSEFKKNFIDTNKVVGFEKADCFRVIMNRLSSKVDISLNWNCSMAPCTYYSWSLEKSIYKVDLIRLMRSFKCADTSALFLSTKGTFTAQELGIIKQKNKFELKIDTMILYGKYLKNK